MLLHESTVYQTRALRYGPNTHFGVKYKYTAFPVFNSNTFFFNSNTLQFFIQIQRQAFYDFTRHWMKPGFFLACPDCRILWSTFSVKRQNLLLLLWLMNDDNGFPFIHWCQCLTSSFIVGQFYVCMSPYSFYFYKTAIVGTKLTFGIKRWHLQKNMMCIFCSPQNSPITFLQVMGSYLLCHTECGAVVVW